MSFQTLYLANGTPLRYIPEDDYVQTMTGSVKPELDALRTIAEIPVAGGTLHGENYILPCSNRALVLLHGYTETAEKFREMVWYFLQAGFSVFSYDQRGHGQSVREVEDLTISHVEHFDDYVRDCETYVAECVRKALPDAQLFLYAHSMGGAIGAHMLAENPTLFCRAVLTSPMIAPSSAPFPMWVGRLMAQTMCLMGKSRKRAFIAGPYDPEKERFETSYSTGRERYDYYQEKRAHTPHFQNCSPSYRWVLESVLQTESLMVPEKLSKVQTPVLVCQAGLDNLVLPEMQQAFAQQVPDGQLVRFENARHEIYNSSDETMNEYVKTVLDFLTVGRNA